MVGMVVAVIKEHPKLVWKILLGWIRPYCKDDPEILRIIGRLQGIIAKIPERQA